MPGGMPRCGNVYASYGILWWIQTELARAKKGSRRNLESALYRQMMEHIRRYKSNSNCQSMLLDARCSVLFSHFPHFLGLVWNHLYTRQWAPSCFVSGKDAQGNAVAARFASPLRFSLLSSIRPSFPPPWKSSGCVPCTMLRLRHVRLPMWFARIAQIRRSADPQIRATSRMRSLIRADSFFLLHFFF